MSHHPLGGTSHDDVSNPGRAMSRNHNQIGLAIAGDVGNFLKGRTHADKRFFQELRFDHALGQRIQVFLNWPNRETLAHRNMSQVDRIRN